MSPFPLIQKPVCAQSLQSCLTLCDPMDCSPPGSSVQGILQERILESVAMPSSRGPFRPRDQTSISRLLHRRVGSLPLAPAGKPTGSYKWPQDSIRLAFPPLSSPPTTLPLVPLNSATQAPTSGLSFSLSSLPKALPLPLL